MIINIICIYNMKFIMPTVKSLTARFGIKQPEGELAIRTRNEANEDRVGDELKLATCSSQAANTYT